MKTKFLGLLAVGLLTGPMAATAATLVLEDSGSLNDVSGGTVVLARFDPTLGTLLGVTLDVSYEGRASGFGGEGELASYVRFELGTISIFSSEFDFDYCDEGRTSCSLGTLVRDAETDSATDAETLNLFTGPGKIEINFEIESSSVMPVSSFEAFSKVTYRYAAVPVAVPEPGTLALLGLGFAGLGLSRRRKAT